MGVAALVITGVAAVAGAIQKDKANVKESRARDRVRDADKVRAEGQRKVLGIEQKIQEIQNRNARVAAAREVRLSRADSISNAEASGVSTGSSASAFKSQLTQRFAGNLATSFDIQGKTKDIFDINAQVSKDTQTFLDIAGNLQNSASKDRGNAGNFDTIGRFSSKF